jgi:thioredoxin reductase
MKRDVPDHSPAWLHDRRYDVLVVGGGQAGLATGFHLARAGLSYLVLEGHATRRVMAASP